MEIAVALFIVLVVFGSLVWGKDSRIDDTARRRRYLG
jgi:hypothetical protein